MISIGLKLYCLCQTEFIGFKIQIIIAIRESYSGQKNRGIDVADPTVREMDALSNEYLLKPQLLHDCLQPEHLPIFTGQVRFVVDDGLIRKGKLSNYHKNLSGLSAGIYIHTLHQNDRLVGRQEIVKQ
jgi:hypothetical protein